MDFLVHMEVNAGAPAETVQGLAADEARRARELADAGVVRRLWRVPGRRANWGIWSATNSDELHAALASLPLFPFMTMTVHPLARHPNDPGLRLGGEVG